MTTNTNDRKAAQRLLADLLTNWTTNAAFERLSNEARDSKQSVEEVALRVAGNLLNSFSTHRS